MSSTAVGETSATILSAYRTAETNAMLARTTFGVAEHSQHILGRALDLRLDSKLAAAMKAARAMQRGGVGLVPAFRISSTSTPGRCGTGRSTRPGSTVCWCLTAAT